MTDPLHRFEGRWRLTRRIEDARAGETVTGTGTAEAVRAEHGLVWREEVTLVWPGRAPLTGTRGGRWEAEGAGFRAFFEDGRFFHAVESVTGRPEARHDCPPDLYRVAYDFTRWPDWEVVWRVTGPRKDYVMTTRLSPERPAPR